MLKSSDELTGRLDIVGERTSKFKVDLKNLLNWKTKEKQKEPKNTIKNIISKSRGTATKVYRYAL
jgi:hypothetical protein